MPPMATSLMPEPPVSPAAALIVTGHQPELFHPGVWVKNFALQGLARADGATALNLVVDYDTVKATVLRVPAPHQGDNGRAKIGLAAPRRPRQKPVKTRRAVNVELLPPGGGLPRDDWRMQLVTQLTARAQARLPPAAGR